MKVKGRDLSSHSAKWPSLERFCLVSHWIDTRDDSEARNTFAHARTFINLVEAYLCSDCEAVGNSANRCPRCGSNALFAIRRAIQPHCDSVRILCGPLDEQVMRAA
jgi:DNA-directed RNA polymerase subunit RPC12/RpoP